MRRAAGGGRPEATGPRDGLPRAHSGHQFFVAARHAGTEREPRSRAPEARHTNDLVSREERSPRVPAPGVDVLLAEAEPREPLGSLVRRRTAAAAAALPIPVHHDLGAALRVSGSDARRTRHARRHGTLELEERDVALGHHTRRIAAEHHARVIEPTVDTNDPKRVLHTASIEDDRLMAATGLFAAPEGDAVRRGEHRVRVLHQRGGAAWQKQAHLAPIRRDHAADDLLACGPEPGVLAPRYARVRLAAQCDHRQERAEEKRMSHAAHQARAMPARARAPADPWARARITYAFRRRGIPSRARSSRSTRSIPRRAVSTGGAPRRRSDQVVPARAQTGRRDSFAGSGHARSVPPSPRDGSRRPTSAGGQRRARSANAGASKPQPSGAGSGPVSPARAWSAPASLGIATARHPSAALVSGNTTMPVRRGVGDTLLARLRCARENGWGEFTRGSARALGPRGTASSSWAHARARARRGRVPSVRSRPCRAPRECPR